MRHAQRSPLPESTSHCEARGWRRRGGVSARGIGRRGGAADEGRAPWHDQRGARPVAKDPKKGGIHRAAATGPRRDKGSAREKPTPAPKAHLIARREELICECTRKDLHPPNTGGCCVCGFKRKSQAKNALSLHPSKSTGQRKVWKVCRKTVCQGKAEELWQMAWGDTGSYVPG